MRPVNQVPRSLKEIKRSPLASSRNPDNPPKPGKAEVSTNPLRYSSAPNRTRAWSLVSKKGIGRDLTSIEAGAVTETLSDGSGFGGGCVASCARAISGTAATESPAAVKFRKRRRLMAARMRSGMQSAPLAGRCGRHAVGLAEQFGELFGDGTAEFFGVDDGDRAAIIARDVVADADRDQFHRRAGFDFLDDVAQMALQIVAGIDRQRRVIDWRAVGNHHQDLALFGTSQQPLVRPVQRFAVDVFLQ